MPKFLGIAALLVLCGCISTPQNPVDTAIVNAATPPQQIEHQGARLDARFAPVAPGSAEALKLDADRGMLIVEVVPGGLAAKSGLAKGDVLLAINGIQVNTQPSLVAAINAAASHHNAEFELSRDGVVRSVTIPL
jgi:S1-C subfamily serine protease